MLTISQVGKSYGPRVLFSEASLQINRSDRIALVGPNGAGKSTLFSIILGENSPDEGTLTFERNVSTGYLPQESAPIGDETVLELATAITPEFVAARQAIRDYEAGKTIDSDAYHEAQGLFMEFDGYQLEPKAKKILNGLAFCDSDFDRPAKTMSGGWVMRAHLARLLVRQPDLLMLDEPTNHLDLESLQWFQNYLKQYPGAILMISHDREFINDLVDSIIEIKHKKLHRYRGNYDDYLIDRVARAEQHEAAYRNQQREIQGLQQFVDRFRAQATKASQAQSKLKQIERMEKIEAPVSDEKKIHFRFPQPARTGLKVITLKDIHHAYGELSVYRGINFAAERGQRTVLVGPNGAGKSTLLKILSGTLEVQKGEREVGLNVKVGYYSQYRVDMLNPQRSVLDEAMDTRQPIAEQAARTILGSFLFSGDDVFKKVSVLSGGEKSRLALVKLLLDPPNLLLMDEPTTHLDIGSIDALVGALEQFEGTLIFISHDVYFIRKLASTVLHINAGKLTPYAGNYDYYLEKSEAVSERAALTAGDSPAAQKKPPSPARSPETSGKKSKEQKRREAEERQARSETRKRIAALEAEILEMETRQEELAKKLEEPETSASPGKSKDINLQLMKVNKTIQHLTDEWDALAETEMAPAERG